MAYAHGAAAVVDEESCDFFVAGKVVNGSVGLAVVLIFDVIGPFSISSQSRSGLVGAGNAHGREGLFAIGVVDVAAGVLDSVGSGDGPLAVGAGHYVH